MTTTATLREIQTLIGGRNTVPLELAALNAPNGPPSGQQAGYEVRNVINAFAGVELQKTPGRVEAVITVGLVADAVLYTIDFNSIGAVSYTAGVSDDANSVAAGLVTNAGSTFAAVGTLAAGTGGTFVMLGVNATSYTVAVTAGVGGSINFVREATSVVWRKWYKLKSAAAWYEVLDSERTTTRNENERHVVAGLDRFYIEVVTTDGAVKPAFARCDPE